MILTQQGDSDERDNAKVRPRAHARDLLVTLTLLVVFSVGFSFAMKWPFQAGLMPRLATGLGVTFSTIRLATLIFPRNLKPSRLRVGRAGSEDVGDSGQGLEYGFARAGRKKWITVLAYITAFFVLLYACGLYFTAPTFALIYLRFEVRTSWIFSMSYAAVIGAVVYWIFEIVLKVPVPPGLFY